jgi:hypothetical protein
MTFTPSLHDHAPKILICYDPFHVLERRIHKDLDRDRCGDNYSILPRLAVLYYTLAGRDFDKGTARKSSTARS